ncbi:MAG: SMC-Scp complex subunit ScpB [Phycisphaerae bacterium]|nr:SMC-Scp complex subunit ScpB [Phycisphaerae bacterium]
MTDPQEKLSRPPQDPSPAATVEAILFTSDSPLSAVRIAEIAELHSERAVKEAVAALNARYERDGAAFRIEALAGGYQMLTRPEFHDCVARLLRDRGDSRLSQAAMETLAIVAYRQPILRADVEAIRGVACGEVLRGLLERQLIKIVGRAKVIGRPMLYGTTRRFLEVFGLESLEDLPKVEELRTGAPPARPEPVEGRPELVEGAPAPPLAPTGPAPATGAPTSAQGRPPG